MFSHKTEEIRPNFGAPVNFFLLYFVTQITQITQIFSTAISCHADFFAVFFLVPQISDLHRFFRPIRAMKKVTQISQMTQILDLFGLGLRRFGTSEKSVFI